MIQWLLSLEWRQPLWLLLAFQPLLLWQALRWLKNKQQQRYADEELLPWVRVPDQQSLLQRLFSRNSAYVLAVIGLAIALAGPRVPDGHSPNLGEKQLDVMLLMDLSYSMQAQDIKPSRIRRAVLEAYEFLSLAKQVRVGVVVYAARPHLLVPVTDDFTALEFYLKDLDSIAMPTQGSDAASAIRFSHKELLKGKHLSNNKLSIVWFTDGDLEANEIPEIEQAVTESGIKTYVLGFGYNENASIPLKDGRWLENDGKSVMSLADMNSLKKMAKKWGGVFSAVQDDESDWKKLYNNGILKQIKPANNKNAENWKELFHWFLWPSMVLLMLALYPSKKSVFALAFISLLIWLSPTAFAEEGYMDNLLDGASIYENAEYERARAEFIQAVLQADTDEERGIALHNLGNSLFKTGDYENAFYLFNDALFYNNEQKQSIWNRKLTLELFKLLKQRQQKMMLSARPIANPDQTRDPLDLPETMAFLRENLIHTMDFKLPEIPEKDKNRLLEKGLERIQLQQKEKLKNESDKLKQQKVNEARLYLNGLQELETDSSSALWKRLFEIEEGFPASLDEAQSVPGLRPW